jgi:hypothetical protein
MASGVPGEHGECRQIKFVDEMLQSTRVLVPAVEKDYSMACGNADRGPIAVEQTRSVACRKKALFGRSHSGWIIPLPFHQTLFSASPFRTRLKIVAARSRAISLGNSHAIHGATAPPKPIQVAMAPNANARSLLPMGPS